MVQTKKELNNIYSFKDAFTTYFVYAIVGIAISVTFNIILFNVIDPGAKETVKELSIEAAVNMMKKFNTPTAAIKEAVEKMEEQDQFETFQQLKGSIFSIIFSAIFGVILAAIFKSKPSYQE
jgi:Na+/H+-dicarboxylate symporter